MSPSRRALRATLAESRAQLTDPAALATTLERLCTDAAFLFAHHLSYAQHDVDAEAYLARRPRLVRRAGGWLIRRPDTEPSGD